MVRGWRRVIRFLLNFFLLCLAVAENKQHEDQAATYQGCAATYQRPTYDIDIHSSDPTRVCRHDRTAVAGQKIGSRSRTGSIRRCIGSSDLPSLRQARR
jgi:hypothetical protein